ncbi:MAG: crossover junction endodeoxyribonuclease RuvC [Clostridiales bacterium]|nr:crossover junction endodeoxyribonuclease RuvC [Clostridiales bacterium]
MVILGIDPGYAILGYGVIEKSGARLCALDYGVIETKAKTPFPERLHRLYDGALGLIERFSPDQTVFEELFFNRNVTTALQVGAGRGVVMLAMQQAALPLYEYTPMQIKMAVTGNGHAEKEQVQHMVRVLLNLAQTPRPDDVADALAVAVCHANTMSPAAEGFRIK